MEKRKPGKALMKKKFNNQKSSLLKHNYIIYLREIINSESDQIGRCLMYYQSSDKTMIECKLRSIIQIPVDQNDVNDEL